MNRQKNQQSLCQVFKFLRKTTTCLNMKIEKTCSAQKTLTYLDCLRKKYIALIADYILKFYNSYTHMRPIRSASLNLDYRLNYKIATLATRYSIGSCCCLFKESITNERICVPHLITCHEVHLGSVIG